MNDAVLDTFLQGNTSEPYQLCRLFEHLTDIYFFVKNRQSEFLMANRPFLELCRATKEQDIIGKTDLDFFSADRARTYIADDQWVMDTGRPLLDKVELGAVPDDSVTWYVTTKIPLFDREGGVIGLAGMARDMRRASATLRPFAEMAHVIAYLREHLAEPIPVRTLASLANLSVSQFQRKFKATFQVSPGKYLIRLRIEAACQLLAQTNTPISDVAQNTGFYDHSHFTRQFVASVGMTPKAYRNSR